MKPPSQAEQPQSAMLPTPLEPTAFAIPKSTTTQRGLPLKGRPAGLSIHLKQPDQRLGTHLLEHQLTTIEILAKLLQLGTAPIHLVELLNQ